MTATDRGGTHNSMPDRLTTDHGTPVADNRNSLTAGRRGPVLLADHQLVEKLAHLNRERIPERVVGARGTAAFGFFQPVDGLERYTKAGVFADNRATPVAVRFSTFTHSRHTPETLRDLRGFAVKFYTPEGNYDLVCGSLPVFFIRDGMRFPDLVHALKPDPAAGLPSSDRTFDFFSLLPESTHALVWLYSDHGIPKGYRHMPAYSVSAYMWINARGDARYVKYHWRPSLGAEHFSADEARTLQGRDVNHATRDLSTALRGGSTVEYDLLVQIMEPEEQQELRVDALDATIMWPQERWPLVPAGHLILNRAPLNDFAESEQLAFSASTLVPGIELSADRLLQPRAFAYPDAQRHRLGVNHAQLAVNRPRIGVHTYNQDGSMVLEFTGSSVNYEPSASGEYAPTGEAQSWSLPVEGSVTREPIDAVDDFAQAGETWRGFTAPMRLSVIRNLGDELATVKNQKTVEAICAHLKQADALLGDAVLRRAQGRLDDLTAIEAQLSPPAEPSSETPAAPGTTTD